MTATFLGNQIIQQKHVKDDDGKFLSSVTTDGLELVEISCCSTAVQNTTRMQVSHCGSAVRNGVAVCNQTNSTACRQPISHVRLLDLRSPK